MPASTCPTCRHPVRTILTEAHRRIAVDPTPNEAGTVVLVDVGVDRRGHVLTGREMPWLGPVTPDAGPFVEHRKTCGKAGKPPPRPTCIYCRNELHPLITARGGTRHWLCGPDPKPPNFPGTPAPVPAPVQQPELLEAS